MPPQPSRHRAGGSRAEKRVEDNIAGLRAGQQDAIKQSLGLLRRVRFCPAALDAFLSAADRKAPVRPHLEFVVERLHRAVIERIFRAFTARCPDQRLVRIGEPRALEIGHRIGLAPDDIVQNPEARILQARTDAENIVIAADHPERAVRFQDAARFGQPCRSEGIISGEGIELVPVVIDGIDASALGPEQITPKLEIIGRIGKDHVDTGIGQRRHRRNAIIHDDPVKDKLCSGRDRPQLFHYTHYSSPFQQDMVSPSESHVKQIVNRES